MNKIRKGDRVAVLSGRDRGRRGEVRRVILDHAGRPERVEVEGINMLTSFVRPNPQKNEAGGLIKREAPLHVSNVAVIDPETDLPARVKIAADAGAPKSKKRAYHVSRPRRAAGKAAAEK